MKTERQFHEKSGRRGEDRVAWWLRLKGYHILAQRAKAPVGEVDLIIRRGHQLIAAEVKTRKRLEDALASLERHRWSRTQRALEWWSAANPPYSEFDWRFDAVAVAGWRLKHIRNAWQPCF